MNFLHKISKLRVPYREDALFVGVFLISFLVSLAFLPLLTEGYESMKFCLMLVGVGLVMVVAVIKMRSLSVSRPILLALGVFILVTAASVVTSIDLPNSVLGFFGRYTNSLLFSVAWAFLIIAYMGAMRGLTARAETLIRLFIIVATAAGALMIIHSYGLGYYPGADVGLRPLIPGFIGNQNFTAMFIVGVVPLLFAVWDPAATFYRKLAFMLSGVILTWSVVTSASRGAIVAMAIELVALAALVLLKQISRQTKALLAVVLISFIAFFLPFYSLNRAADIGASFEASAPTSQYRFIVWDHSVKMIEKYPWLGIGPGNFFIGFQQAGVAGLPAGERFDDAHNLFLHIAVGGGLLGLGGFVLILACAVFLAYRSWRAGRNKIALPTVIGLLGLLLAMAFNPVSISNWLLLGFLISLLALHSQRAINFNGWLILKVGMVLVGITMIVYGFNFIIDEWFATRSTVAYRSQDYTESYKLAREALQFNRYDGIALSFLAASSIHSGVDANLSRRYIEQFTSVHPRSSGNQKNGADLYFMLYENTKDPKDLEQSQMYLNRALTLEPHFAGLYTRAGYLYFRAGDIPQATKYIQESLALDTSKDQFYTWLLLAKLYQVQGKTKPAVEALEHAQQAQNEVSIRRVLEDIRKTGDITKVNFPLAFPPVDII